MTDDLGLLVEMPNGEDACFYCDDDHPTIPHSYWRATVDPTDDIFKRGKRLTGVTTITKTLDVDPKHLLRWAARVDREGVATLVAPLILDMNAGKDVPVADLDWIMDPDDIWEKLNEAGLTFEQYRDERGTIGRNIHRYAFQALAEGEPVPFMDKLTAEEKGWARAVVAFWLDHEPKAEQVEQIMVNLNMGVAGRTDFRGELGAECEDDACPCHVLEGPGIVDAKTGGFLGASDHAQVNGYRLLSATAGFGPCEWGALLKLREDGTYQLIRAEGDSDDFVDAVSAYRAASRINGAAAKARKARG